MEVPAEVSLKKLLSKKFKLTEVSQDPKTYEILIGDIYSEEERNVVISLEVKPTSAQQERLALLTFEASYLNVINSKIETFSTVVYVDRDENVEPRTPNALVIQSLALF